MAPAVRRPVGPDEPSASWPRPLVDQLAPAVDEPVGPAGDLGGKNSWEGKKTTECRRGMRPDFGGIRGGFFSQMDQLTPWDLVKIEQIRRTRPVDPRGVGQLAPSEMLRRPVGPGSSASWSRTLPRPVGPHEPSTSWPRGTCRIGEKRRVSQLTPLCLLDQLAPTNRRPVDPQWTW